MLKRHVVNVSRLCPPTSSEGHPSMIHSSEGGRGKSGSSSGDSISAELRLSDPTGLLQPPIVLGTHTFISKIICCTCRR